MWSFKLKEVLFDCLNSLKVDKTEGKMHSLFNYVFRGQHLSAKGAPTCLECNFIFLKFIIRYHFMTGLTVHFAVTVFVNYATLL